MTEEQVMSLVKTIADSKKAKFFPIGERYCVYRNASRTITKQEVKFQVKVEIKDAIDKTPNQDDSSRVDHTKKRIVSVTGRYAQGTDEFTCPLEHFSEEFFKQCLAVFE